MGKGILIALLIVLGLIIMPFLGILFLALSPILLIFLPIIMPVLIIGVVVGFSCGKEKKSK